MQFEEVKNFIREKGKGRYTIRLRPGYALNLQTHEIRNNAPNRNLYRVVHGIFNGKYDKSNIFLVIGNSDDDVQVPYNTIDRLTTGNIIRRKI